MAFSYGWRGPNIVKDGLIFYMDPGSPNSYQNKTSTLIKDISGYGNNGTLLGGSTYDESNGGSIVFDGNDDYISCIPNTRLTGDTSATLSSWFKTSSIVSYAPLIAIGGELIALDSIALNINTNGNQSVSMEFNGGQGARSSAGVYTSNVWTNFTAVKTPGPINTTTTLYINGQNVSINTASSSTPSISSTNCTFLGKWVNSSNYFWDGNISTTMVYNKALTAQEVLQNFNVTKTRFGL